MTQKEKIAELKSTITYLYEKEGRSKSYISRLLEVDRKTLLNSINEWGLVRANIHRLTPSNQKFANKHKQLIKIRYDNDIPETKIAEELGVTRDYLRYIVERVEVLKKAKEDAAKRRKNKTQERIAKSTEQSKLNYDFEDIKGEIWREILGYEDYYISNMGRVKHYAKRYKKFYLLQININCQTGRQYIKIGKKGLQIARLVGFAFVDGYSEIHNTIDHIDNDFTNNRWDNLQWVSQAENNKLSYDRGRKKNISYTSNKKFKKIILDSKYEFKTITALAKFLNVSVTQVYRYISKETPSSHTFEFIY